VLRVIDAVWYTGLMVCMAVGCVSCCLASVIMIINVEDDSENEDLDDHVMEDDEEEEDVEGVEEDLSQPGNKRSPA
jgi:hypothetical protein